jgi:hypothetical protein
MTLMSGPWMLRFTFDPLNYWFSGLSAWAVPASVALLGMAARTTLWRIALFGAAALLAIPFGLFGLVALYEAKASNGVEHPSRKRLAEVSTSSYTYRLYQTDCGATCAYGLELRKEIGVLGVMKLVSRVWASYREEPATLRVAPGDQVQVVRGDYGLHTEQE